MRQAGRYLPNYQALRASCSLLDLFHTPELIAEATLLPFHYLRLDAAILFSDILVVAEALGAGLQFDDKKGPIIERPVRSRRDIEALTVPSAVEALHYVQRGISLILPQLSVPLIGFAGAPFTVASYLVEGGSSQQFKTTKKWLMSDPEAFHSLLEKITAITIDYLNMQIAAGVHVLQLFDSWANQLAPIQLREFVFPYLRKVLEGLSSQKIPTILFCRGSSLFATELAALSPTAISIDWSGDLGKIRSSLSPTIALQGNLDPDVLFAPKELIKRDVHSILDVMKGDPAYIFNLGHGVQPGTPLDAVHYLIDLVHGRDDIISRHPLRKNR